MKRLPSSLVALGLALIPACGGDDGPDERSAPTTAAAAGTTSIDDAPTPTAPEPVDGILLEAGDAPPPWTPATGDALTFTALAEPEVGSSAIACPSTFVVPAGNGGQCTVHDDEGGAYASTTVGPNGGASSVTLLCQEGDGLTFAPVLSVVGRVASAGPGASDGEGRFFSALAIELDDGVHWFVLRRPAGEDCPVVWDLGIGDSIGATSSLGGATFPLVDGPTCTRLDSRGLVVRTGAADGICT